MAWVVTLSPRARRDLKALPSRDREAVLKALRQLTAAFGSADVKKLEGKAGSWRLRVGRWRVLFMLNNTAGLITVDRVVSRDHAY